LVRVKVRTQAGTAEIVGAGERLTVTFGGRCQMGGPCGQYQGYKVIPSPSATVRLDETWEVEEITRWERETGYSEMVGGSKGERKSELWSACIYVRPLRRVS